MAKTGGLILCGGQSSRMGSDKGRLRFAGETLLERVLRRMLDVAEPVVISMAADVPAPPLPPGVRLVRDSQSQRGPLWGLLEGFRALSEEASQVLVLPVDMPFFTPVWLRRLQAGLADKQACLCQWEGVRNALCAAYQMTLLPRLEQLVAAGQMRPILLAEGQPTAIIVAEAHWKQGQGAPPLMDVDTPQAYRKALLLEGIGHPRGAPIWLELHGTALPSTESAAALPPLPLYALDAQDALHWAALLYPEHAALFSAALSEQRLRLLSSDGTAVAAEQPFTAEMCLQVGGHPVFQAEEGG